ncbi:MAG TPA: HNH endonuclease signature motif containing protein [Pirellulales bacterium]|jgi:hypothetical protein
MTVFRKWVKSCFDNLVDPDKDQDIADLTQLLHQGVARLKQSFSLDVFLKDRPYKQHHLEQAKINVYQKLLERAWKDGRVEKNERATLAWVATCLRLPESTLHTINIAQARPRFATALAQAMDDGVITPAESAMLAEIAAAAGRPLNQFMQEFFQTEGELFLSGIFVAALEQSIPAVDALERIVTIAGRLGLSRADVLTAIRPQAVRYIEHVLADSKLEGALSQQEEALLLSMLGTFEVPSQTRNYVLAEMQEMRIVTDARIGRLPTLPAPTGLSVQAGELVHFHGEATWESVKLLKSGPSRLIHYGTLTITDSRLAFSSTTRSDSFGFSRIVAYDLSHDIIAVQLRGKPTQRFICNGRRRIPCAILQSALAMANQVLRNQDESRRSRHIARDVRQRVWQRYGGKCAECAATNYLEFDHIVPVAKGGSNSDGNVQLLCRNCNLKKSDGI